MKVTPDRYLTYRYAGASGDYNPIHLDDEFARSVGLPGRILHGLWTMAQVARAQTEAGGRPARAAQPRGPVPRRRACPRRRSRSPPSRARTARSPATRSRTARRSSRAGRPSCTTLTARRLRGVLTPRQELLLRKVVEGYSATGLPVGSKALAADPDISCGPSTVRNELAVLEELGLLAHPHTSAGRAPTDAGHRYYVDRLLPERALRDDLGPAPGARAARGRRGDARDHRDALAGHRPARDRLRAADRDHHDPPHRGPGAPAAGADGRDHHLHRRRLQARLRLRAPGRRGPRRLGRRPTSTSGSSASGSAPARCARGSRTRRCRRPSARSSSGSRPPSPSSPGPPTPRCTSTARRG